ncbi:hypothetical protein Salat_1548600 [Sesamum alatum]|uniref:Uncharacterized protein n=1 Tax=Sesamum alatum TaxID=300844 RepID=A0AAE1YCK8_9LAMI|nr:hypothetical protein Salat_1548600 [Sesamum alatum]
MSAKACLILLFAIVFLITNSTSLPTNNAGNMKMTNNDEKNNDIGLHSMNSVHHDVHGSMAMAMAMSRPFSNGRKSLYNTASEPVLPDGAWPASTVPPKPDN